MKKIKNIFATRAVLEVELYRKLQSLIPEIKTLASGARYAITQKEGRLLYKKNGYLGEFIYDHDSVFIVYVDGFVKTAHVESMEIEGFYLEKWEIEYDMKNGIFNPYERSRIEYPDKRQYLTEKLDRWLTPFMKLGYFVQDVA